MKQHTLGLFFLFLILSALSVFTFTSEGALAQTTSSSAVSAASSTAVSGSQGPSREALEAKIKDRASELESISRQIESTQATLKETREEKATLQREVRTLDASIATLGLSIKGDQISIQKLGFEIESLNYDLQDIRDSAVSKQDAIGELLRSLQKSDRENLLAIMLRSGSLAEGVFEAQAVQNLQSRLAEDIASLRRLDEHYNNKIKDADVKKRSLNIQRKNLENRQLIVQDTKAEREQILKQTKNKESVYEQQFEALRKVQQQIASEIESLEAVLRTKIDPSLLPQPATGVLAMPIQGGRELLSQDYGATAFAQYGYRGKWHNGVDFRSPVGTPIVAGEDGVVAAAGDQDRYCYRGAYGKFVVVHHNNNLTTLYAHLSRYAVQKGDTVVKGQVIGYVGRTGYATGPHLHFTVFASPTFYMGASKTCGPMPYGGDLNPLQYL